MALTGCTIQDILPSDNPNEGRVKINQNFDCLAESIGAGISGVTSAHTIVLGGINTEAVSGSSLGITTYTINLLDDIYVNNLNSSGNTGLDVLSANTMYSGFTDLYDIFVSETAPSTQQIVDAVGDTITTGLGTPTVTSYDIGVIYITTFDTTNTATGTSINIDSVGVIDVEKYDVAVSGFTSLDIGDIQAGVQYFLTYNGSIFQFSETNPDSSVGNYTTPSAIPINIGGVTIGTTYNDTPVSDVFDDLFFPYLSPIFTSFKINGQSTVLEVGNSVVAGSKTFSWGTNNSSFVEANSIDIKDVSGGNVYLADGMPNVGSTAITISSVTKSVPATHTWQARGLRTNNVAFARNFNVYWRWRVYYGTSSLTGLTSAQITGLTSSQLDTTIIGDDWDYLAGDYKYLCVPSTFGEPNLFRDLSTNLSVSMASTPEGYTDGSGTYKYLTVNVANQYGVTQNYKVYRTRNLLGGSINIKTT